MIDKKTDLRTQAEEIARGKAVRSPRNIEGLSIEGVRQALHDLQVHQVELETQNQELRRTQIELEASRARYWDLYDVAPIGYITISEKGLILEANLTAATLLGVARADLAKRRFILFILKEDQNIFYHHYKMLSKTGAQQSCELRMLKKDGMAFWTLMQITAEQDIDGVSVCRIVISDISNKKEAEEDLRENQAQFRRLFNEAPIGAAIVSLNYRFLVVNEELFRITGYLAKELTSLSFCDITHPDDLTDDINKTRQLEADEIDHFNMDKRYLRPDGSVVWISLSVRLIRNRNGRATSFLAMMIDINERKRAEAALRESEDVYRTIFENNSSAMAIIEKDTTISMVNKEYCKLGHYEKEDVIGLSWTKQIPPEDLERLKEYNRKRLIDPESAPNNYEFTFYRKDGEIRHAIMSLAMIHSTQQILCSFNDITDRKQAEAALLESEKRFRVIANYTPDWESWVDANGKLLWVNPSVYELTGYSVEECMDMNDYPAPIAHQDDRERMMSVFNSSVQGSSGKNVEFRILCKDGSVKWAEVAYRPIYDENRENLGHRASIRDISSRKQVEEELNKYREDQVADLRRQAEIIVREKTIRMPENMEALSPEEARQTLHELRVHQIELEIQNRELRQTQKELDAARTRYFDLYDMAPVGYVTLSKKGLILETNLTAATLLGVRRVDLVGRPLSRFIPKEDQDIYYLNHKQLFDTSAPQVSELRMVKKSGTAFWTHLEATAALDNNGAPVCHVAVIDISGRKQAEERMEKTLESLRKAFSTTIQVLVSAVETRDPYTSGHQNRSAGLARAIAVEMGLFQDKIDGISMAGSIHDIGKLSIPAEILAKPTKLSEIELPLIRQHAQKGYEMLKDVESPWPLAEMVYQHHERMDGSGYPRCLKGDEILMEARILAVADVVESMASHRPYRPALGINAALAEIDNNKGTLYDADVVDACLRLFREKGFEFEKP